jgi:PAS domain-containing protein
LTGGYPVIRDVLSLPVYVEAIGALITLAGFVWAFLRWVWPAIRGTGSALSGLLTVGMRSDELLESVAEAKTNAQLLRSIKHEVMPNGSGSLRDAVTRTEAKVNMLVAQQRARADSDDDAALLDCDEAGRVEWLSRALMIWTQRTSDELKGSGWISSIHPDEREDVAEEWFRCVRFQRQFDAAFQMINRAGDIFIVRMAASPIKTLQGDMSETTRWAATMRRSATMPGSLLAPERNHVSRPTT